MPAAIARLGRVRVFEESTFGADLSASVGSFVDLRGIGPVDVQTPLGLLKDDSLRQRSWGDRLDILGPRGHGKTSIKSYLMASGVALDNAASAPATPRTAQGRVLKKAFMDGWVSDKGDLATAGSTTTVLNMTVGTRTGAGRALVLPTGAGGALEMREVASVAANAATLKQATSNAQTNGAAIYNTETFYPGAPGQAGSLQFLIESAARKKIHWLLGAQLVGGLAIDLPSKGLPGLTYNIESADWKADGEVGTPIGGAAIAAATYTDADPLPFTKSYLFVQDASSSVAQSLDHYELKIGISWGFEEIPSVDVTRGVNGIAGWYPTKAEPLATVSFKIRVDDSSPYDEAYWRTRWQARTPQRVFVQVGNTLAQVVGISLPNCQITDLQPVTNAGSLVGWQVTMKALEDAYATDQSTLLRTAPFRLHTM